MFWIHVAPTSTALVIIKFCRLMRTIAGSHARAIIYAWAEMAED